MMYFPGLYLYFRWYDVLWVALVLV